MAGRCIVCKKELPEDSKLPVCEYHKGVAVERAKQVGTGAAALGVGALVIARDTVGLIIKDKALPIAKKAAGILLKR